MRTKKFIGAFSTVFTAIACVVGCGDDSSNSASVTSELSSSSELLDMSSGGSAAQVDSSSDGAEGSSGAVVAKSSSSLAGDANDANVSSSESSVSSGEESSASTQAPADSLTAEASSSSAVVAESSSVVGENSSSDNASLQSSSAVPSLLNLDFFNGVDISTVQEYEKKNIKIYDVDGTESDIFTILKNHGFNSIRLRTFVSPLAEYGYAAQSSECGHSGDEAYGDKDHIVEYAKKIKAAGMGFLLDIHYSDNWADPGKQIIPSRWRNVTSSEAMKDSVYNYTRDLMESLKAANVLPEMVQIGNETTPGILIHKPNNKTDCWGNGVDKASTAINGDMGTAEGKANAAKYFNAGIKAVKDVSPLTKTVLHIERIRKPETVNWWMGVVFDEKNVPADVMGFSAYTAYGDGAPNAWESLFNSLTSKYSQLEFIVAEYNGGNENGSYSYDGSRKKTIDMIRSKRRWIGTFFWEPTLSGAWGPALFDWEGNNLKASAKAFKEFD